MNKQFIRRDFVNRMMGWHYITTYWHSQIDHKFGNVRLICRPSIDLGLHVVASIRPQCLCPCLMSVRAEHRSCGPPVMRTEDQIPPWVIMCFFMPAHQHESRMFMVTMLFLLLKQCFIDLSIAAPLRSTDGLPSEWCIFWIAADLQQSLHWFVSRSRPCYCVIGTFLNVNWMVRTVFFNLSTVWMHETLEKAFDMSYIPVSTIYLKSGKTWLQ